MSSLWMDCGWRSGVLGSCYYGYRREMERLKALLSSRAVAIVSGPRGSGKSEFLRYFLENFVGRGYILIDPEGGSGKGVERVSSLVSLRRRFLSAAESAVSVFRAVRLAGEALLDAAKHIKGGVVLAVDTLPGVSGEDVGELVAMASMLTNNPRFSGRVRAIVVADSRMLTHPLMESLSHLSIGWVTLEGIDDSSMAALLNEYVMGGGECGLGVNSFLKYVGGLPAYVTSPACYDPKKWLRERTYSFKSSIVALSREAGVGTGKGVEAACRVVLDGFIDPVREPLEWFFAEGLLREGFLYRVLPGGDLFRPSLRYYRLLCEELLQSST